MSRTQITPPMRDRPVHWHLHARLEIPVEPPTTRARQARRGSIPSVQIDTPEELATWIEDFVRRATTGVRFMTAFAVWSPAEKDWLESHGSDQSVLRKQILDLATVGQNVTVYTASWAGNFALFADRHRDTRCHNPRPNQPEPRAARHAARPCRR